jgi:hypothetical protein
MDTELCIHASRSGTILWRYKSDKLLPFRCASFGYGGAWVVVENNGVNRPPGLSENIVQMVEVGNVCRWVVSPMFSSTQQ